MFSRIISVAVVLTILFGSAVAESARETRCGSDSDCVTVKDKAQGGQLLVDGLDLSDKEKGHTIATVEERLPSWFGPARPLQFTYGGKVLDPKLPLATYGIKVLFYKKKKKKK